MFENHFKHIVPVSHSLTMLRMHVYDISMDAVSDLDLDMLPFGLQVWPPMSIYI